MAALRNFVKQFSRNLTLLGSSRNVSLSATACLKEITEKKEGNTLTIEAAYVPDKNEDRKLKIESNACPLCALGLDVKHTDVLILKQFLRSDGCMLPRRITGLCKIQQKRISDMVAMAQKAGLLRNTLPSGKMSKDPKLRKDWKKFNTYYDETTIRARFNTHY